jgi:multimeric flavodoxin WrbA
VKVVAFNGSPREKGNTYHSIQIVFEELKKEGIETELVQLGVSNIKGCKACYKCFEMRNKRCTQDDELNLFIENATDKIFRTID